MANAPVPFGSFRRATDLAYGSGPRQRLDVFSPQSGEHPVVVFLYGGSWTEGSKSQYAFVGAALAARGYVTVIPDYRLYPQVRFPELMADPANAVAWVRAHAREFGGDPDRIYLMGHSAGAYMAAMLALNGAYLRAAGVPLSAIAGLVGLSGPYVLVPNTESLDDIFASPYTTADWQPERFASSQAPPTLLLHGLEDRIVSPQQTRRLTETLASYHVEVDSECYPKRGHADTIASFALVARFRTPALEQTVSFLDRVSATGVPAAARSAAQTRGLGVSYLAESASVIQSKISTAGP